MDAFNSVVGAAFQPALQMVNWGLINWDDYQQFGGRASTTVNVGWFKNTVFNPYGHIAVGIGNNPLVGLNPTSDLGFVAQVAMWGIACLEFCDPLAMTVVPGRVLPEDPNTAATQLRSLYVSADQGIAMQTFIGLSRDNPPDYSVQGSPPACDCGSWAQQVLRFGGIDPGPPAWKPETLMQQLPALPMMYMQTGPWWEGFPHN